MKKKTIGTILIIITVMFFISIQFVVFKRVIIQSNNLTEICGIIEDIQKIEIPRKDVGYDYAFAVKLDNSLLEFAIQEKNEKAYDYIVYHNIIGKRAKVLYDKYGYNSNDRLTFHVYYLEANGTQILDIDEAKQTDKFGLFIWGAFDIFIVLMILYMKRKKLSTTYGIVNKLERW